MTTDGDLDHHAHDAEHRHNRLTTHESPQAAAELVALREPYAELRAAVQILGGAYVLARTGSTTEERQQALNAAVTGLRRADATLRAVPRRYASHHLSTLRRVHTTLTDAARRIALVYGPGADAEAAIALLTHATNALRRAEAGAAGLVFFGSGGCADIDHALLHI